MKTGGIYALKCPITDRIRYIGQTQDFRQREAIYRSRRQRAWSNQRMQRWFERLDAEGLVWVFEPLLITTDQQVKDKVERRLIKTFGRQLLNHRAGGLNCNKPSEAEQQRKVLA
jgi:hypothetical protein